MNFSMSDQPSKRIRKIFGFVFASVQKIQKNLDKNYQTSKSWTSFLNGSIKQILNQKCLLVFAHFPHLWHLVSIKNSLNSIYVAN